MNICFDIYKVIDIPSLYLAFYDKKGMTYYGFMTRTLTYVLNSKGRVIHMNWFEINNLYCKTTKKDGISVRIFAEYWPRSAFENTELLDVVSANCRNLKEIHILLLDLDRLKILPENCASSVLAFECCERNMDKSLEDTTNDDLDSCTVETIKRYSAYWRPTIGRLKNPHTIRCTKELSNKGDKTLAAILEQKNDDY